MPKTLESHPSHTNADTHTHTHTHTHTRTLPHSPTHAPSPLNLTLVNSQPHPSPHTTHALFLLRFIYTPTAPAPQFPFPIFSPQFTITSSGPLYCVPCEGNCVIITQTLSLKLICGLRKLNTKRGMSCNGCRVLRKGCSESCILRPCLQWIESPEAQGHATVFVAKFFGRAGLMSFISNVPEPQRPGNSLFLLKKKKKKPYSLSFYQDIFWRLFFAALFQSLLFEACGRTVNPVNGAVGLLWTGNWHVCQAAVETVLRGGTLRPMPELLGLDAPSDDASEGEVTCTDMRRLRDPYPNVRFTSSRSNKGSSSGGKRKRSDESVTAADLNLRLMPSFVQSSCRHEIRRPGTPSMNSEESVTTTACLESEIGDLYAPGGERKVLNLFIWGFSLTLRFAFFWIQLTGSHARVVVIFLYVTFFFFPTFWTLYFEKRVFTGLKSGEIL